MKIYVARHGQTQLNVENRVCGSTDIPLTELGLQQAQQLADNARGKGIDIIIASTMIRAQQTAQAVADRYNLPVITDHRLREQDFGRWEGTSRDDPEYQREKRKYAHRHFGGESAFQLAQRVYNRMDEITEKYKDKTVLIVCHGGVCRTIRTYFEDMENEAYSSYSPDNASLVEYDA
ncbi:MAG: histidine phosphatase family protein [Oscillospiraceae bacterium]|nr:histidine phosphatase family protein [Oscillospiraceae bacterium]